VQLHRRRLPLVRTTLAVCCMQMTLCLSLTLFMLCRLCYTSVLRMSVSLEFKIDTKKSVAIRIGSRYKNVCVPLVLCGVQLQYVQQVKNLGVMLVSARSFKHSISHVKEKFYRCFNAM